MPIEITGQPAPYLANASEGAALQVARNEPTASQEETHRPASLDTVSLTDAAALLHRLDEVIAGLPVVDAQRVENIQQALANGSFEVDTQRVAERLLNFETAL